MTRTDFVLNAISAELERHRAELDADETTRSLTLILKLNEGGFPRSVIFQKQSERDLRAARSP